MRQLEAATANGRPVIATVRNSDDTFHALVVDGITTRQGARVVAIRDPYQGQQYFELYETFSARYHQQAIEILGRIK